MKKTIPIKGYGGLYTVNTDGRIFSIRKMIFLKPWFSGRYASVSLFKDGVTKNKKVSRIIAESFVPNPKKLPCVDHIDGDTTNDRANNLRWCSYTENNLNTRSHTNSSSTYKGVYRTKYNKKNPWRSVASIKYRTVNLGSFNTQEEAANAYNLFMKNYYKNSKFLKLNKVMK